jgi:hypothetical protein
MTRNRRACRWALRSPWTLYVIVAIVGAGLAYFALFSQFQLYDDSGHISYSLITFVNGKDLYESTYSQYGPFYFELFGGFFKASGIPIDTNSVRLITLGLWVASGVGFGVLGEQLTGDRWVGVFTEVVAFSGLMMLAYEPMHPIALTTLMLVGIALGLTRVESRRATLTVGCLAGLLLMVKINMGALAFAAIIPAALIALPTGTGARRMRIAGAGLLLLTPTVLFSTKLGSGGVRDFWILEMVALLSIIVVAWRLPFGSENNRPQLREWLTWLIVPAAAVVIAAALAITIIGTSPHALVEGILIDPTRHPGVDTIQLPRNHLALLLGCVTTLMLVAFSLAQRPLAGSFLLGRTLTRLAAALVIAFTVLGRFPATISPWDSQIAFAALVCWLAATAPPELEQERGPAFTRLAIVLFSVMEVLQAYPTAGSELAAAKLGLTPVMVILLWDGMRLAHAWQAKKPAERARTGAATTTGLVLALAFFFAFGVIKPLRFSYLTYKANVSFNGSGASMLQLPAAQSDAYKRILADARSCSRLITLPGSNSFNIWSQRPPADGNNATNWMLLVSADRQRAMIAAVSKDPDICVLKRKSGVALSFAQSDPPTGPLPFYDYLNRTPLALKDAAGGYELFRRTPAERKRLGGS